MTHYFTDIIIINFYFLSEASQIRRALATLPGHEDEVYALDWSPTGYRVASGSKDCMVKIWRS